jgi:protein-S-isoprenylcysteine O-methyltransferase Ste14
VSASSFFARWRVRLGYPLAVLVLFLARPTPRSIFYGAAVGVVGLLVRGYAAGYLHKQEVLTVTGPYAHTRNPLYFGSAILTAGVAIATWSWIPAAILCAYFALFYSIVMRREEQELRLQHGAAFDAYATAVPLFLPSRSAAKPGAGTATATSGSASSEMGAFSIAQYNKNREYRAAIGFLLLLAILLIIWRLRLP